MSCFIRYANGYSADSAVNHEITDDIVQSAELRLRAIEDARMSFES